MKKQRFIMSLISVLSVIALLTSCEGNTLTNMASSSLPEYTTVTSTVTPTITLIETTIRVKSSVNPSKYGQSVTLTATIDPIPDAGSILFIEKGANLDNLVNVNASGEAIWQTPSLSVGKHVFIAGYRGDAKFAASSGNLEQHVNPDAWVWGRDNYILHPDQPSGGTPAPIIGLNGVTSVAGGGTHNLALLSDGTVWAWGSNSYGQLGNTTTDKSTAAQPSEGPTTNLMITATTTTSPTPTEPFSRIPVQVKGLSGIVAVAAGENHSLALKSDGTVWAWGDNFRGQLGNGTNIASDIPVQVRMIDGVIAISAGLGHSLALMSNGTVWAWGSNDFGELGNGTKANSIIPVHVTGLHDVITIAGGGNYSLALKSDGTVWTWGTNLYAELGNGTLWNCISITPGQVTSLSGVVAIAAGVTHRMVLKSDGTVWGWGFNQRGQLGNGTTFDSRTLVQVLGLSGIIAISAGLDHSMALKSDGTVWAWGNNQFGQLGDSSSATLRIIPFQVSGLTNITAIAAGYWNSLALQGTR